MDPTEIARLLASGDKEQIKQAQKQLQALGFDIGPDGADGSLGKRPSESKTMAASKAYAKAEAEKAAKRERKEERAAEIELLKAQGGAKESEAAAGLTAAETEAKKLENKARKEHQEAAGSALGMTTQTAANLASPIAATAGGYYVGGKANERFNRGQARKNEVLRGVADDRVKGLTTREGAVQGAKLAGAMPQGNAMLRGVSRMAPHLGLAGVAAYKGIPLLSEVDETQPFYPQMADRAAGLGYLGFGSGLLKRGIEQATNPGTPPDAKSLAIINSNRLIRNAAPEAASGPKPGSKTALLAEAKEAGITGRHKMNVSQLAKALANVKGGGAAAIPLAVGSYMAGAGDSEAADGSLASRAGNAAVNFGTGAGAAYGGIKLADLLAKAAPNAMRAVGPAMTGIGTAASAYDYAQEAQQARQSMPEGMGYDLLSQAMPAAQRGGEMAEAWRNLPGQAQKFVQRNQSDPTMGMSNEVQARPQQPAPPPRDPMMHAAALEVPQNIPAGAVDQAGIEMAFDPAMRGGQQPDLGLPPDMQQQIQMLAQQGASPDLIAAYLNQIAAQ